MSMYKLYAGASYTKGSDRNYDEVEFLSVTELCLGIVKVISEDPYATSFTFTVSVLDDPPPKPKKAEDTDK